ncbi:MAG: hypothetical protein OEW33_00610 [Nitrospirota bacterium]|nr:hypothetical protein [Nitrospirota bacterium]MDH4359227.1 hypothetical protein [Nitrospirota bacterium]
MNGATDSSKAKSLHYQSGFITTMKFHEREGLLKKARLLTPAQPRHARMCLSTGKAAVWLAVSRMARPLWRAEYI